MRLKRRFLKDQQKSSSLYFAKRELKKQQMREVRKRIEPKVAIRANKKMNRFDIEESWRNFQDKVGFFCKVSSRHSKTQSIRGNELVYIEESKNFQDKVSFCVKSLQGIANLWCTSVTALFGQRLCKAYWHFYAQLLICMGSISLKSQQGSCIGSIWEQNADSFVNITRMTMY